MQRGLGEVPVGLHALVPCTGSAPTRRPLREAVARCEVEAAVIGDAPPGFALPGSGCRRPAVLATCSVCCWHACCWHAVTVVELLLMMC